MGRPNVIVNEGRCVHRNKKIYMPGKSFEASEKEKERLILKGAVSALKNAAPGDDTDDDIIDAIKKVIENGDVTNDKKPKKEAIESILGRKVSAAERDAALEKINAGEGGE
ncbi:MAG: hypothetical protein JW944_11400 [Deltaproteobacteria bacterium]|nr:hypothetical protein [Deltaproteobacteria bacterium]